MRRRQWAGDVQLGLHGALDTAARREGLEQGQRQCGDSKREIAGRRIDRTAHTQLAAAQPERGRFDRDTCARDLHMGRRRERQRHALIASFEALQRHTGLACRRLDLGD